MLLGDIKTFPGITADKDQILKMSEELLEVYGAWEDLMGSERKVRFHYLDPRYRHLLDECADLIMATCNLLAGLGVKDATELIRRCEERNEERGRYEVQE